VGAQPSWREAGTDETAVDVPVTLAAARKPATRYGEPPRPAPHDRLAEAAVAAMQRAADKRHVKPPVADGNLFDAASDIALVFPRSGPMEFGVETWLIQRHGMIAATPRLVETWTDESDADRIVAALQPTFDEMLDTHAKRFGLALASRPDERMNVLVILIDNAPISIAPLPREASDSFRIEGMLDAGFREPEVWVSHEDGSSEKVATETAKKTGFRASVSCGKHRGKQQIEIEAEGPLGPDALANFPVWCGTTPPETPPKGPAPEADIATITAHDAETRLLALVNRDRQAAGLAALVWDDHVADVARAHSDQMKQTATVAHSLPGTGPVDQRIEAAGIKTAVALENVARAYGIASGHEGFMNSPGHRANLMSSQVNRIGIGIAFADGDFGRALYITEIFTRVTPKIDPVQAAEQVRKKLAAVHPVTASSQLSAIAQQYVEGLATGGKQEQLEATQNQRLEPFGNMYSSVSIVNTAVSDLDTLDAKELIGKSTPDEVGIGIAQGKHPRLGENAIWVEVLIATRRKPK
jgi:uncharacterized protein YkwD